MSASSKIKNKLKNIPRSPGVYLFLCDQKIIYVGKAKKLKPRVSSYFSQSNQLSLAKVQMVAEADDLQYIVVASEKEALLLEANLIKKHQPKYNVLLKDDKSFSYLLLDYSREWPELSFVRQHQVKPNKNRKYFGPYTSAMSSRNIIQSIKKIFPICLAPGNKQHKPCFNYQISRCHGACVGAVTPEEYKETFKQIERFLRGDLDEVLKNLKIQMKQLSADKKFELAAKVRDEINNFQKIKEKQKIISLAKEDADYLSVKVFPASSAGVVNILMVRSGKLLNSLNIKIELSKNVEQASAEILQDFVTQFYNEQNFFGQIIYIREDIESFADLEIRKVQRGERMKLIKTSERNALEYFKQHEPGWTKEKNIDLKKTKKDLKLKKIPHRIECYDISNIQGNFATGSMVVAEEGELKNSEYRQFKIKHDGSPDDFAMMAEVLTRRFGLASNGKKEKTWKKPDLIVIDGGKGQLNRIYKLLQENNIQDVEIISLAKRLEEIFFPGVSRSLILPRTSPTLKLLQNLRDEAHRFAISFYRARHTKATTKSWLDDVPGIGPVTRKKLIQHFGSSRAVKQASLTELQKVIGAKAKLLK